MSIQISFADLTYVNQGISSNSFPFGAALVASYAKKNWGIKSKQSYLNILMILKII